MKRKYLTAAQREARILEVGLAMYGSRNKMARAMGVTAANLKRTIRIENPGLRSLRRISEALNVDIRWLSEK